MTRRLILLVVTYLGVMLVYRALQPIELDWRATYERSDKIPFGAFILFDRLEDIFAPPGVRINNKPFYNYQRESNRDTGTLIAINQALVVDRLDTEALMTMVDAGLTVFMSAEQMSDVLLDTLGITLEGSFSTMKHPRQWMYHTDARVALSCLPDTAWEVATDGTYRYFDLAEADSQAVITLGTVNDRHINFLRYRFG
ncbi:MAG: hypothetical protein R3330_04155, partial [Saprospiraceae bacterium]|nr:hypothetical protein [Saprospiraceae bacterium]